MDKKSDMKHFYIAFLVLPNWGYRNFFSSIYCVRETSLSKIHTKYSITGDT